MLTPPLAGLGPAERRANHRRLTAGSRPLWVMSDLEPKHTLEIDPRRMKIEESFKDLKDLIGVDKIMNRRRHYAEQMIALALLAFSIFCMIGEQLRDHLYGPPPLGQGPGGKQWGLYSGAFVLLRQKPKVPFPEARVALSRAYAVFPLIFFPDVPTCVPT
jgi:hypothetical protein